MRSCRDPHGVRVLGYHRHCLALDWCGKGKAFSRRGLQGLRRRCQHRYQLRMIVYSHHEMVEVMCDAPKQFHSDEHESNAEREENQHDRQFTAMRKPPLHGSPLALWGTDAATLVMSLSAVLYRVLQAPNSPLDEIIDRAVGHGRRSLRSGFP